MSRKTCSSFNSLFIYYLHFLSILQRRSFKVAQSSMSSLDMISGIGQCHGSVLYHKERDLNKYVRCRTFHAISLWHKAKGIRERKYRTMNLVPFALCLLPQGYFQKWSKQETLLKMPENWFYRTGDDSFRESYRWPETPCSRTGAQLNDQPIRRTLNL